MTTLKAIELAVGLPALAVLLWYVIDGGHWYLRRRAREIGPVGNAGLGWERSSGWHHWFAWRPVYVDNRLRWLAPLERNITYFLAVDHEWCRTVSYRTPEARK